MTEKKISDFYDQFTERQLKIGANERLVSLYFRLLKLGLQKNSKVLELGCGVGLFTRLLSQKISSGSIEAVDISQKSIKIAKNHLSKNNIQFFAEDVISYHPKENRFDFITLLDVIEHIPLEEHAKLFRNLGELLSKDTLLIINIPNPKYISFLQKHHPESLQIIDQPVEILPLLQHFEDNGIEMLFFEKYGIWENEDYHFMVLRKNQPFELKHLSEQRSFFEKINHKISHKINRLRFG